jgi:hypothetical protein
VLQDVDNRLTTIFDALRMPKGPQELGAGTQQGKVSPASNENPFFVLLEDDRLITHVSVTTDMLLERSKSHAWEWCPAIYHRDGAAL